MRRSSQMCFTVVSLFVPILRPTLRQACLVVQPDLAINETARSTRI
jgi:hypothetical protein